MEHFDNFGIPLFENENDQVLWENTWLKVMLKDKWYTYVHFNREGTIAALIFNPESKQILARQEKIPSQGKDFQLTSLTGGVEGGLNPKQTAVKEIKEEAGIDCNEGELIDLGFIYSNKFTDMKTFLFALNGSNKTLGPIKGDGSKGEKGAWVEWIPAKKALELHEPTILSSLFLLRLRGINLVD